MHPLARNALRSLWDRGNRADIRGSERRVTLPLTDKSFPAYSEIEALEEKQQVHAELREAERVGAIRIEWDRRAGADGQIRRLVLMSLDALAPFLGETKYAQRLSQARERLHSWLDRSGTIRALIQAWSSGRSPRGITVDRVQDVVDVMHLLDRCEKEQYRDISERRVSAILFGDSKRIEALVPVIDLMTAESFEAAEARRVEQVLAPLGLLRHPQPLLVSGALAILAGRDEGSARPVPAVFPYLGFSPRHVFGAAGTPRYILSIENLTVFHELATGCAGTVRGCVLHLGGFPSPTMVRAYQALLRDIPQNVHIFHWGDQDLGGFRIADLLARAAGDVGRSLSLWKMGNAIESKVALSLSETNSITEICRRWSWDGVAETIARQPNKLEQEVQDLELPDLPI